MTRIQHVMLGLVALAIVVQAVAYRSVKANIARAQAAVSDADRAVEAARRAVVTAQADLARCESSMAALQAATALAAPIPHHVARARRTTRHARVRRHSRRLRVCAPA